MSEQKKSIVKIGFYAGIGLLLTNIG
jgi:hypothetical protein